jgi:hypothetical protein
MLFLIFLIIVVLLWRWNPKEDSERKRRLCNFWRAVLVIALTVQGLGLELIASGVISLFLVSIVYWPWRGFVWLCRRNHPDWFPKYEVGPDGKKYTLLDPNWENDVRVGDNCNSDLEPYWKGRDGQLYIKGRDGKFS